MRRRLEDVSHMAQIDDIKNISPSDILTDFHLCTVCIYRSRYLYILCIFKIVINTIINYFDYLGTLKLFILRTYILIFTTFYGRYIDIDLSIILLGIGLGMK